MADIDHGSALRSIPDDALIESSFRRLLSSVEGEKETIRNTWQQIELERECTTQAILHQREQMETWASGQQLEIDTQWEKLTKLGDLMGSFWPEYDSLTPNPIEINCVSGGFQKIFTLPRTVLRGIKESVLAQMFSDEMLPELQVDAEGRFLLDFNPECFALVIDYLQNRRLKPNCPIPHIPREQQQNMEILAERLCLTPFLKKNEITPVHGTSLQVLHGQLTATHPGWQVISSRYPLTLTKVTYFETTVKCNPDPKGGLAIGICNRMPDGTEVHSIGLIGSVLYVSGNGLRGDMIEYDDIDNVKKELLTDGCVFGVSHGALTHDVTWWLNGQSLGTVRLREDRIGLMRTLFPVFGMYIPGQKMQVDFSLPGPPGHSILPAITG